MGEKSAFYFGYNNSNDGSYRSLINISKPENVFEKTDNTNHNQWVQANGPFKIYMQNVSTPNVSDWQMYGMNATIYSSDQSYWGFGDVPQPNGVYSRIRTLLGIDSKCLIALWTTTGLNIFHQACNGQSIGIAMKDIINHNATNQYLEKPPQQYDTQEWWNRTHFEIWGDPTLNLFQVQPVTNLSLNEVGGNAVLQWTSPSDTTILGYHIYESASELGIYQRISNSIITDTFYQIPNYQQHHWYMVRALKMAESGCGKFLHPSLGQSLQANISLNVSTQNPSTIFQISPNPSCNNFRVISKRTIQSINVFNSLGVNVLSENIALSEFTIDATNWQNGLYIIELQDENGNMLSQKVIKTH